MDMEEHRQLLAGNSLLLLTAGERDTAGNGAVLVSRCSRPGLPGVEFFQQISELKRGQHVRSGNITCPYLFSVLFFIFFYKTH